MSLYELFRVVAFRVDPERAHNAVLKALHQWPRLAAVAAPGIPTDEKRYKISKAGLSWSFPVGLAAGFDKNAIALEYLSRIGFGAIEVGTVTPVAQPGNPRPRIFRYPALLSLRNTMGFPNQGVNVIRQRLTVYQGPAAIGVNIGKNKTTAREACADDYRTLCQELSTCVDYIAINVSSPNTPGLREFQDPDSLKSVLSACKEAAGEARVQMFLKVSPDLSERQILDLYRVAREYRLNGIIATNTTVMEDLGNGGVSGGLLRSRAAHVRNLLLQLAAKDDFVIIGCGGFSGFSDVLDFWRRGGMFVQVYTSFVYRGPQLLQEIRQGIDRLLDETGAECLQDLFTKGYFQS